MRTLVLVFALSSLAGVAADPSGSTAFQPYSPDAPSVPGITDRATGFFRVVRREDGRWWFIDPLGRGFYLMGVDWCTYDGFPRATDRRHVYGGKNAARGLSRDQWAGKTLGRLRSWGFSALGTQCDPILFHRSLPHCTYMALGGRFRDGGRDPHRVIGRKLPNVWHPAWESSCKAFAREIARETRDDPWLIGYFLDNEQCWYVKGGSPEGTGIYEGVCDLPVEHPARRALDEFLGARGLTVGKDVAKEVREEFCRRTAERYYSVVTAAIREADPNHLILGDRYEGLLGGDPYVWKLAGRYCDTIALNCYPWADLDSNEIRTRFDASGENLAKAFARYYDYAQKPFVLGEWAFIGMDTPLPSDEGAGERFHTQAERAHAARLFAQTLMSLPFVAGYDYFMWNDAPAEGIGWPGGTDPLNANYGLVSVDDTPYPIAEALKTVQTALSDCRARPLPAVTPTEYRGYIDLDEADRLIFRGDRPEVEFVREDSETWSISNARGFRCRHVKGEKALFSATLADRELGSFSVALRRYDGGEKFSVFPRLESVFYDESRAELHLRAGTEKKENAPDLSLLVRLRLRGDGEGALVAVEELVNRSKVPVSVNALIMTQSAPYAQESAFRSRPRPIKTFWMEPRSDLWLSDDGRYWGGFSCSRGIGDFAYKVDEKGKRSLGDVVFGLSGKEDVTMEPNRSARFGRRSPWMLLQGGLTGVDGWKTLKIRVASSLGLSHRDFSK